MDPNNTKGEYVFLIEDIAYPNNMPKASSVKANDYDGAEKQIRNRFPEDKYKLLSCMLPNKKLKTFE